MKYRKSPQIRLKGYDYSLEGAFFVTLTTKKRRRIFGHVFEQKMELSELGSIVEQEWLKTEQIREEIWLDEFCVMPDHFHGIIGIVNAKGEKIVGAFQPDLENSGYRNSFGPQCRGLATAINQFKGSVSRRAKDLGIYDVWQRRFHDRIIRDEKAFQRIKYYIRNNPRNWKG